MLRQPDLFSVPPEPPIVAARRRGERAAAHADAQTPGWVEDAMRHVVAFAQAHPTPFLMEQAREYAEAQGLPEPPDRRAWGAVTRRLQVARALLPAGHAKGSNACLKCLWVAA